MENDREEVAAFEGGRQAWTRLKKTDQTWGDWVRVGLALEAGRVRAMRLAQINQPVGRRYNENFGKWLAEYDLDTIDKAVRSRLLECMKHRVEIEDWREQLTTGERLRYNHPDAVLRRWKAATQVPDPNKPRPSSPMTKMKDLLVEAEERAHAAEAAAKRADNGSNINFDNDNIPDIARFLSRGLVTEKRIRQLIAALNKEAKRLMQPNT
jgi:hypothetical protein